MLKSEEQLSLEDVCVDIDKIAYYDSAKKTVEFFDFEDAKKGLFVVFKNGSFAYFRPETAFFVKREESSYFVDSQKDYVCCLGGLEGVVFDKSVFYAQNVKRLVLLNLDD